ncbi:HNH endonuclease signature motif containing protein [Agrococcus lahaulensis]|uniref:HNH endonuclease signature motif containing protein n=1 Tax=Agrococcus lahaulensis TaxID=341722 RepID=UPI00047E7540|nr:HNH endonuclease signature motif containing protein [Agrococcus lahaulensis]
MTTRPGEGTEALEAPPLQPRSAAEIAADAELDAFWLELSAQVDAMSEEQVQAAAERGAPIPPLPRPPESTAERRLRLDAEFVERFAALEAETSRIEGERRALMAEHLQRMIDQPGDTGAMLRELASFAAVEVGLASTTVERRMSDAWSIVTTLPAAHEAAAEGRITTSHLRVIEAETRPLREDERLEAADRERVVAALVDEAERSSVSRLRSRAKQLVNDALTTPLQIRHETARQRRRVEVSDAGDGMVHFYAFMSAVKANAAMDRLTQAARARSKDDPRTIDQFRADALEELLLGGVVPEDLHGTSGIQVRPMIVMPADALCFDGTAAEAEAAGHRFPAMLDGKVIVDLDTARRLAGEAPTWLRLFTHPVTGVAVTVDSYTPTAAQRHALLGRDVRCRAPGCDRPARRADLDHTRPWSQGGETSLSNLAHICRRDHCLKHDSRWAVEQLPGGVLRWTSPLGQVIDDLPEPVGPVFTDLPRTRARPPKRTPAQRRADQRAALDRLGRWDDPTTWPEPDPAVLREWYGNPVEPAAQDHANAPPLPF